MDNNHWTFDPEHWTFAREIFKGEVLGNEFISRGNFFAHYVFPFAPQRSATISLKTYGSKMMNIPHSFETEEVSTMVNKNISSKTEQVLIGSLLGDGGLVLPKNGINAYFREMHSVKQREYLEWKKEYFEFFNPKITKSKIFDNRTNKYYYHTLLWTKVDPILTKHFRMFYQNGKKSISKTILNKIGPLALAVWYCDDGSFGYINQNGKIATYLSYEDNKLIAEFLKKKFNINCTVNKDGKSYHLYFSVKEVIKFLNLIKDYVPKCMSYKLGPLSKGNFRKLKEENLKRRERDKIRHKRDMNSPLKRAKIREWSRNYRERKMQDPKYRGKYNEYSKLKEREYRKKKKQSSGNRP